MPSGGSERKGTRLEICSNLWRRAAEAAAAEARAREEELVRETTGGVDVEVQLRTVSLADT